MYNLSNCLDGLNLKHMVDLLLYFFIERGSVPSDEDVSDRTELSYFFNIFVLWNYMVSIDKPDECYRGWTNPYIDAFEYALQWCFIIHNIPGKICRDFNDNKYVQGISLGVDTAFFIDCIDNNIDYRLKIMRDDDFRLSILQGKKDMFRNVQDLDAEIYRLERIKEEAGKHLDQAFECEKRMGYFDN